MTGTLSISPHHAQGFRFIHGDDGQDYFSLVSKYVDFDSGDSDLFRSMAGTKVRFEVVTSAKGLRAERVEELS